MGNAPSQPGNESNEATDSVDAVTFTNNPYQKHPQQTYQQQQQNQQHGQQHWQHGSPHQQQNYMSSTHQRHTSSPGTYGRSSPSHGLVHPSAIPTASIPVDTTHRPRFPLVREQYLTDSPAGSSPFDSDSSYPHVLASGHALGASGHPPRSPHSPMGGLPGGGPRRRASSLASGQPYSQYTDSFNEQALLATAAQQDKLEQKLHSSDGKPNYRNSARVSRAFDLEPLKSLDGTHDDPKDGNVPTIITWSQGGTNVYVTGTFNNWKQKLHGTSDFSTILNLPPGTHRIKFIVDDEWKCSTELSAATDAEGNLVNFLEVTDEEQDELEGGY
ncbi:galactose metabolism- protein, partial [Linnemannia zychae]